MGFGRPEPVVSVDPFDGRLHFDACPVEVNVTPLERGRLAIAETAVFLPERLGFMFVGAAEMAGCVMFDELRRVGIELFADEPEVAERVERLYSEILTDEVGHVGYCASRCTPAERAMMRWLYPRIGRLFAHQTVEISLSLTLTSSALASTAPSTSRNSPPD